ncbi:MAG TPA: hypothetical protein VGG26_07515 [Terracidiphilus sp.]
MSLLVLGGTILLVPLTVAAGHGRVSARTLEATIVAYIAFVAFAVILIVRRAHARFPKSNLPDNSPLDDATRGKLRRRIWLLQFFLAVYALGLLNTLVHIRSSAWLVTAIGAAINLLIQIVLIKAIRRLKRKLNPAGATTAAVGTASRSE